MSEVVAYRGRLVPVDLDGMTLEDKARSLCGADELFSYNESWLEQLLDESYDDYHYSHQLDTLFTTNTEELDPNDFSLVEKNDDGSYSFMVGFYNGGAGLGEVLESGLQRAQGNKGQ